MGLRILTVYLSVVLLAPAVAVDRAASEAASLLQSGKRVDVERGIRMLKRQAGFRDPARAVPAAVLLSKYFRDNGRVRQAVALLQKYGGYDAVNIQPPRVFAYLEFACAIAADGRVREAAKRLDFAQEHDAPGVVHAAVLAAAGDIA